MQTTKASGVEAARVEVSELESGLTHQQLHRETVKCFASHLYTILDVYQTEHWDMTF